MQATDQILAANQRWVEDAFSGPEPVRPARHLVVLTCMDSRIDVFAACGLTSGQAHVVRNAGGLVTEDMIRSITISQRKLGTVDVVIIQHTDCGMNGLDDDAFRHALTEETSVAPPWDVPGFDDLDASVRRQVDALAAAPWVTAPGGVAGLVYDVATGRLRLVCEADPR